MRSTLLTWLILGALFSGPETSADAAPATSPAAAELQPGWKLLGFPAAYYTPDTGLGLMGIGLFTYRPPEALSIKRRASSLALMFFVTTRGQHGTTFAPNLYFDDERWNLRGVLLYMYFPARFYGFGNDVSAADPLETFSPRSLLFAQGLQRKVWGPLSLGAGVMLRRTSIRDLSPEGPLAESGVAGLEPGTLAGFGPQLEWDSRDHGFSPTEGGWHRLQFRFFDRAWGSQYSGTQWQLDLRQFFAVGPGHVLGVQAVLADSSAELPFYSYAPLHVRGIREDRYRARSSVSAQAELRFPISGRFSGAGFLGTGRVGDGLADLALSGFRVAGGAGLRYQVEPREKVNLRLDIGVSELGVSPYILLQEAF